MKLAVVIAILFKYQGVLGQYREYPSRYTNGEYGSCQCNYTDIFSQLPHFIQALGRDDRFSFAFQGKKGEPGDVGPIGPQGYPGIDGRKGEEGIPGERGELGTSLIYHPSSSQSTNYSPATVKREIGLPGKKGQKGEPGGSVYETVLRDGSYIEVKGEKGNMGRRGRKGDTGKQGPPGVSIQGDKGSKGEPAMLPNIELLRGRPGPQGPPGTSYQFDPEILARVMDQQKGRLPILIPVPGPPGNPGLSIVGEKGDPGGPGHGAVTVSNIQQLTSRLSGIPGTLAFVEKDESLFMRVASGWKEIVLGRFIDDNSAYISPHQSSVTENQGFDSSAKHFFQMEKPRQTNQYRNRHKKLRKKVQGENQN